VADGPRKGLSPPTICDPHDLTSCPRHADIGRNAKRNVFDCNHTALHMIAKSGAIDIARLLLDTGADPNIHDEKYDATVLARAEFCEQPQVAAPVRGGT